MRCCRRAIVLSLLVFVTLITDDARARADEVDARDVPRAPDGASRAPPFTFLLGFGPSFGWYAGGHIGLGFAFRLSDSIALVASPRIEGGKGWDENPFVVMGGDVGVRVRRIADVSGVGHVALGTVYMVEIEGPRTNYLYVAPHLRFGGGIRIGEPGKRFGWGVEGTARLGYAFDVTDHASELSDDDYAGVYGAFEVSIVLEL